MPEETRVFCDAFAPMMKLVQNPPAHLQSNRWVLRVHILRTATDVGTHSGRKLLDELRTHSSTLLQLLVVASPESAVRVLLPHASEDGNVAEQVANLVAEHGAAAKVLVESVASELAAVKAVVKIVTDEKELSQVCACVCVCVCDGVCVCVCVMVCVCVCVRVCVCV
jgi:hypothetical protein